MQPLTSLPVTPTLSTRETPDLDLPDPKSVPVDLPLVVSEEAKESHAQLGCCSVWTASNDWSSQLGRNLQERATPLVAKSWRCLPDNFRAEPRACPPRPLPVHERPMRIGERGTKSLPLPQENSGLHQPPVTSIRINCNSFPCISGESRKRPPIRFEKSMMSWISNTPTMSIGEHPFLQPSEQVQWAPSGFWSSRISRSALHLFEEIRFAAVTPVCSPAVSEWAGGQIHVETASGKTALVTGASKGIGAGHRQKKLFQKSLWRILQQI